MTPSALPSVFGGGRYEVRRLIGEGSRKRVFLAYDTRLDREVAFALLKTEGLDAGARTRLRREAPAIGRLGTHPHIVTVHDVGEEDATPYIVSEYLAGGDLEQRLRDTPAHRLPIADVLRLADEVASALEHAHARGVIHRDVKPANVWLTAEGGAKLGDFGLALAGERSRLTVEGMLVGTVAYMAPEQALARPLDARSDLYALGALLYELLTGRAPFIGDNVVAVVSQHLHTAPVAPSWHNSAVPPWLEKLIVQLLAKVPDERPTSAAAVRAALAARRQPAADAPAVVRPATERPNPVARLSGGIFVGREHELAELRAHVEEAVASSGRVLLLVGEPGIGKTRTAQEVATYARLRGLQVLWGRAFEGGGAPPYWPWTQALRGYVHERAPAELRAELGAGAASVAQIVSAVRERLPDLPPPPRLEPEEARFRLFDSVATFVKNAAAQRPLLLVLDDLHWTDAGSLLLLQFVAREIAEARVVVLGTYRDEEVQRPHPLFQTLGELAREPIVRAVVLGGLGSEDVARYLEMTIGQVPPATLVEAAFRQTEGNPFFLGEVVRLLVAEGRLADPEAGAGILALPEGVRAVIGHRLDRLSAECLKALTTAAAVGREFGLDVLEKVTELARERLLAVLEEATAARVITQARRTRGHHAFAHALVRETLYQELAPLARTALHRRIGEALEALHASNPEPYLAELAFHFSEAALGATEAQKAISYAGRAGDRAMTVLAYEEAASHYARALEALELRGPPDEERCDLLLKLGEAQWNAGKWDKARMVFRRAAELAEMLGASAQLARAALGFVGGFTAYVGVPDRSLSDLLIGLLEKALNALGDEDSALRAKVMGRLAVALTFSEAQERKTSLARQALDMARRVGDRETLAHVLMTATFATWGPDNLEELLLVATEMRGFADVASFARPVAHLFRASYALAMGDLDTVDRELEAHELAVKHVRGSLPRWGLEQARAMRALLDGRFEDAERLAIAALAAGREAGTPSVVDVPSPQLLLLRFYQGRANEIVEIVEYFAELYEPIPGSWCALALVYAELGRKLDARREFERLAANDFADLPRDVSWLASLCELADVAALLGDARRAAMLYELLLPYARRCMTLNLAFCGGSISRSLGLLATTFGRLAEAERHFEYALEVHVEMGTRPWLAHTQHDYARMLVARDDHGDRERALELLTQAIDSAQEVGMKSLLERALALKLRLQGAGAAAPTSSIDAVVAAVEHEPPDLRPHAAPDGTVTILFTDIAGSTTMTERLGDQQAHALICAHNALVREQVAAHGGFEVKAQGDGFMVAFASARRALLCAIAVQRALAGYCARHPEEPMRVRIGLHTGEAIREGDDFFGRNVILAARIADQARGGEILVSAVTKDLTESAGDLRFGPGRTLALKGLAGPRRAFEVAWAAETTAPAQEEVPSDAVFRREGDYWTLAYEGHPVRLHDAKGLRYLARLLAHPDAEIHVADLIDESGAAGDADVEPGERRRAAAGDAGECLDPQARAAYRRRLTELREEVEEAEAHNDRGRMERLREEMEFLGHELSSAYGLGGRARRAADPSERMRKGVTNRIREAIERIRKEDEPLARHLTNALRLGIVCAYRPERPVRWEL